uniref:Putative odorant-binding protein 2 n=1 Tax=Anthonomus grandis TaxID=7044 RepID=A0A2P9JZE3_ANTGR|nr:putative odorant-binding protein 2 [Anthonomus grandis]
MTKQSPMTNAKKKRPPRRPRVCCAEESLDAIHEKEKDTSRSCYKEVTGLDRPEKPEHGFHGPPHKKFDLFSCEGVEKRKSDMICIQECVGKKKGMLNEDGTLNPEGITKILLETFTKETWVKPMAEQIIAKCIAEAKTANEKPIKFYTEVKRCSPATLTLKHCMFKEVQLSCPADQIKDKGACEKYQERLKKGELDVPPPPPPPSGRIDVELKED